MLRLTQRPAVAISAGAILIINLIMTLSGPAAATNEGSASTTATLHVELHLEGNDALYTPTFFKARMRYSPVGGIYDPKYLHIDRPIHDFELPAGEYIFVLELDGYDVPTAELRLQARHQNNVTFKIPPSHLEARLNRSGHLDADARDLKWSIMNAQGDSVVAIGEEINPYSIPLPPGMYIVELNRRGETRRKAVILHPNGEQEIPFEISAPEGLIILRSIMSKVDLFEDLAVKSAQIELYRLADGRTTPVMAGNNRLEYYGDPGRYLAKFHIGSDDFSYEFTLESNQVEDVPFIAPAAKLSCVATDQKDEQIDADIVWTVAPVGQDSGPVEPVEIYESSFDKYVPPEHFYRVEARVSLQDGMTIRSEPKIFKVSKSENGLCTVSFNIPR